MLIKYLIAGLLVLILPPSLGAAPPEFAAFGEKGITLKPGVLVASGQVATNTVLTAGKGVRLLSTSKLMADRLVLKGVSGAGALAFNTLKSDSHTSVSGPSESPLTLPVLSLPSPVPTVPGTQDVIVPSGGTVTLAAGSYMDVVVGASAHLSLAGGTYQVRKFTVANRPSNSSPATVTCESSGGCTVQVAEEFSAGSGNHLGSAPGVLSVVVSGKGSVVLGKSGTVFRGVVEAPLGSIKLAAYGSFRGSFIANKLIAAQGATLLNEDALGQAVDALDAFLRQNVPGYPNDLALAADGMALVTQLPTSVTGAFPSDQPLVALGLGSLYIYGRSFSVTPNDDLEIAAQQILFALSHLTTPSLIRASALTDLLLGTSLYGEKESDIDPTGWTSLSKGLIPGYHAKALTIPASQGVSSAFAVPPLGIEFPILLTNDFGDHILFNEFNWHVESGLLAPLDLATDHLLSNDAINTLVHELMHVMIHRTGCFVGSVGAEESLIDDEHGGGLASAVVDACVLGTSGACTQINTTLSNHPEWFDCYNRVIDLSKCSRTTTTTLPGGSGECTKLDDGYPQGSYGAAAGECYNCNVDQCGNRLPEGGSCSVSDSYGSAEADMSISETIITDSVTMTLLGSVQATVSGDCRGTSSSATVEGFSGRVQCVVPSGWTLNVNVAATGNQIYLICDDSFGAHCTTDSDCVGVGSCVNGFCGAPCSAFQSFDDGGRTATLRGPATYNLGASLSAGNTRADVTCGVGAPAASASNQINLTASFTH
jgi:hypothetical protein